MPSSVHLPPTLLPHIILPAAAVADKTRNITITTHTHSTSSRSDKHCNITTNTVTMGNILSRSQRQRHGEEKKSKCTATLALSFQQSRGSLSTIEEETGSQVSEVEARREHSIPNGLQEFMASERLVESEDVVELAEAVKPGEAIKPEEAVKSEEAVKPEEHSASKQIHPASKPPASQKPALSKPGGSENSPPTVRVELPRRHLRLPSEVRENLHKKGLASYIPRVFQERPSNSDHADNSVGFFDTTVSTRRTQELADGFIHSEL